MNTEKMINNSKLSDYDFDLPSELIAQFPVEPRDHCKLMVLNKTDGRIDHRVFFEIAEYFNEGDVLILNDSKVFPARLYGNKETGGKVEILLHKYCGDFCWEVIGRGLKVGDDIIFNDSVLKAKILDKKDETYIVKFNLEGESFFDEINNIGVMPLPPYIKRLNKVDKDSIDYQTVFAKNIGSVAAPTAGLHFTSDLLDKLSKKGVIIRYVTLHVGMGTFAPVKTENIEEHIMHYETYHISAETIDSIIKAKKQDKRVFSVGTTSNRVLESVFEENMTAKELSGSTNLFIYPGYKFKCIDGIITNFHTPKSSLLMLVSALASKKFIDKAYAEAIEKQYRFYSYGDAMLIL